MISYFASICSLFFLMFSLCLMDLCRLFIRDRHHHRRDIATISTRLM